MRGWMRMTVLAAALAAAAGACTRADGIAAPDTADGVLDETPPPPDAGTMDDGTPPDSTDRRWGGHLGSGG